MPSSTRRLRTTSMRSPRSLASTKIPSPFLDPRNSKTVYFNFERHGQSAKLKSMKNKKAPKRRDAGRERGVRVIEAVLQHTLSELAAHGLESLSVSRVAQLAQLNKTSVYRRWPTKEALVAAALEGILQTVGGKLVDTGSLEGDLMELLSQVAALTSQATGKAIFRAALSESVAPYVAKLAVKNLAQQTTSPVKQLVTRAKARGEWRAGLTPEQLIAPLVGAIIHRIFLEQSEPSVKWLRALLDVMLHGLLPRTKTPR
jgi:AcrR family transcriptional regulator